MSDLKSSEAPIVPRPSSSRGRTIVAGLAVLLGLSILIALGTWQVERLAWKEGLLQDIASRLAAPPIPLADIETMQREGGDIEYRRVTAGGRFLNDRERHFFATWQGQTGFYVYTPLELADGRFLFVNRGFVPYDLKLPNTRPQGALNGEQTVTGLARHRLFGKPSWIVPDNDVPGDIFYWKDIDAMTASAGLDPARVLPFFLDADAKPNPGGLPVGGVTQVDLPNNHLQYALTWYGLAAALAGIAILSWWRGRSAPPA